MFKKNTYHRCYNNCPADQGRAEVDAQRSANCDAASGVTSSSAASKTDGPTSTTADAAATSLSANVAPGENTPIEMGTVTAFFLTIVGYFL